MFRPSPPHPRDLTYICNRYIKFLYDFITKKSIFVIVVSSLSRYGNGYSQVCWTGNGYSQVYVHHCRCSTLTLLFSFQHLNDLTLGTRENQEKNYFLGVFNEYLKLLFEVLHCSVNATLCKVLVYKITEETRKICRAQDKAQVKTVMRCAIW